MRPFDSKKYFKGSWGITVGGTPTLVRIKLTGWSALTAAERLWPEGFTYKPTGLESGILSGQVNNLTDIQLWVASQQVTAEILPSK